MNIRKTWVPMDRKVKADNVALYFLLASVELPDVPDVIFVFSWQYDQLCIQTKNRGTEHI